MRVHCAPEPPRPSHRALRSRGGARPCERWPGAFSDRGRRALTEPAQERRDEERQERTELRRWSLKFEGEALLKPAVPEATDHLLGTHHADHDGPVAGQALYHDVTRLRHSASLGSVFLCHRVPWRKCNWIMLSALFLGAGVTMIYGAHRKWSWLVDPPDYLWPVYSQARRTSSSVTRHRVGASRMRRIHQDGSQPLDLAQESGDAVRLDVGGEGCRIWAEGPGGRGAEQPTQA